jgi:hypothetical protein
VILIVTNREDYTADFLILELQRRSLSFFRFNTEDFPSRISLTWSPNTSAGHFDTPKGRVHLSDIQSAWFRRPVPPRAPPELHDPSDARFAELESQAALEGVLTCIDCFWVSHPDNVRRAERKPFQLATAQQLGFHIPETVLTSDPGTAQDFLAEGDSVYKPLRSSRLERADSVRLIYTSRLTPGNVPDFATVSLAPCLFQQLIPKAVDVRVTVVGEAAFAVAIHSQEHPRSIDDWRREGIGLRHEMHSLPGDIAQKCIRLVTALGLAFGAIDLVLTPEGEYVFLEINPNGQWAWLQQLCPALPLRETLADLLSATRQ